MKRRGHTLVELVAALISASALLVGLSSALIVTLRASDPAGSSAATLEGAQVLQDLGAELCFAQLVTEQTPTAITVTVPDRETDADALPESIRYAWSGIAGQPLTRQYNGGRAAIVAQNVHHFSLTCSSAGAGRTLLALQLQVSNQSRARVRTTVPLWNVP